MKDSPILVTGVNGFLGSHIAEKLIKSGYTCVHGTIRPRADLRLIECISDALTLHTGDLTDIAFLDQFTSSVQTVIHAAGLVSYDPRRAKELIKVNAGATAELINACLHNGVNKMVHISSIAALGKHRSGEVIHEDTKWVFNKTTSAYALSKYLGEMEVWRGYHEGLPVTVLSPSVIFGDGNWNNTSLQLVQRIYKNSRFYAAGSTGIVDVSDVAKACVLALDSKHNGKKYIISADNISYKDMISLLASSLGVDPPSTEVGPWLGRAAVILEYFRSRIKNQVPLLTQDSINSTSFKALYDNSRSVQELGIIYKNKEEILKDTSVSFLRSIHSQEKNF